MYYLFVVLYDQDLSIISQTFKFYFLYKYFIYCYFAQVSAGAERGRTHQRTGKATGAQQVHVF